MGFIKQTVTWFGMMMVIMSLQTHAGQDGNATLRGADIAKAKPAPAMATVENEDIKRLRSYPMQPPTIPHHIRDYQTDIHGNKCLACHNRRRTLDSQAPMISVTHYMNRDGNFLADVSPRRYFCLQCHVPQLKVKPLVDNEFEDMDSLIQSE